jgi:drug/metabolite transporter (DMT)-like permease
MGVAGLFVHLMPVFGIVLAWLFLDEGLAPYHVMGIVLILGSRATMDAAARISRKRRPWGPIERE